MRALLWLLQSLKMTFGAADADLGGVWDPNGNPRPQATGVWDPNG